MPKPNKPYKQINAIEVRIWDQGVGALSLDPKSGYYVFAFYPKFRRTGIDLSPLVMPINESFERITFTNLPEATYYRLPPLIADSLPDSFGNALITAWLSNNGIPKDRITMLDRLAYMGRRGIGALEFKPCIDHHDINDTSALKMSELVENARKALTGSFGNDELAASALSSVIRVGTSAGGARAKAVIAWNPETQEIRSGQFDVPKGFEHWLLKFDGMGEDWNLGGTQNYGRIEYAYYLMATDAGINMSPCRLLTENGRAHFMTKRFDRIGSEKVHLQTLCALSTIDFKMLGVHSYNQYFEVIKRLMLGYEALEEGFRRMVFNVMACNCDDHSKNISFMLRQGGQWELAPAYDVTFAYNPQGEWTYQHFMSVNGKFMNITKEDLLKVADRFTIGTAPKVIKRIAEVVAEWPVYAAQAGVPHEDMLRIKKHLQTRLDKGEDGEIARPRPAIILPGR